eukprot:scaffold31818_cov80-Skeletonema_marinoi.AAC.2
MILRKWQTANSSNVLRLRAFSRYLHTSSSHWPSPSLSQVLSYVQQLLETLLTMPKLYSQDPVGIR